MAPARAEVALVQLKNCLVNLPSSLVSVLSNANTVCHAFLTLSTSLVAIRTPTHPL